MKMAPRQSPAFKLIGLVIRITPREQAIIVATTALALPLYYGSLQSAKLIVDQALAFEPTHFPHIIELNGTEIAAVSQVTLLALYCGTFLFLLTGHGLLKRFLNIYKAITAESVLLRMRRTLMQALRGNQSPGSSSQRGSGRTVAIITAELELLSGFVAEAIATPVFELGTLLTAYIFIFVQSTTIGLALLVIYPLQLIFIPRLQERQTRLEAERVEKTRDLSNMLSDQINYAASGLAVSDHREIDALANEIFLTRKSYYRVKFTINFLLNILGHLVGATLYLIGGLLVIKGELTIGSLVALIAAHKDLVPPWKELMDYRQEYKSASTKLDQILTGLGQSGDFFDQLVPSRRSRLPVAD